MTYESGSRPRIVRLKRQPWHEMLERMAEAPGGADVEDEGREGIESGIIENIESLVLMIRSVPKTAEDYDDVVAALNERIQFLNRMLRILPGGVSGPTPDRGNSGFPSMYEAGE